jgi:hypothetical protein
MKKTILFIVFALLLIELVSAGVTNPLPSNIELLKGESGRFKFQIQNMDTSASDITCTYSLTSKPAFDVSFDNAETEVKAGTRQDVLGTVNVPGSLGTGSYSVEMCVSCSPNNAAAGANVQTNYCNIPLNVQVVPERTTPNLYVPEKESNLSLYIAITLIIIIIAVLYILIRKKKKQAPIKFHKTVEKLKAKHKRK